MSVMPLFDAAGRRRSPATLPGYHDGREPRNKGRTYPADPPTVDEIVAVMRQAGEDRHGLRARALIVVLWRAALRIQEALSLTELDLDANRCAVLVQHGKGGHRREVGIDAWAWNALRPWMAERAQLPVGPLFCTIDGPTRGVAAVVKRRRPCRVPPPRHERGSASPVRAASAPARARRRARARGGAAADSAMPARASQHGDHEHVPVGHRGRGGDRDGRVTSRADDVRYRRPRALTGLRPSGRPGRLPLRGRSTTEAGVSAARIRHVQILKTGSLEADCCSAAGMQQRVRERAVRSRPRRSRPAN
jgi:Phage integrase family